jgi:hypothetical protein
MSHQVMLETQFLDRELLEICLSESGYSFVTNGNLVNYRGGEEGNVDILVKVGNHANRVGFRLNKNDNSYNIVGDFYQTGITQDQFKNKLQKNYTTKKLELLLRQGRYTIIEKQNTNKNTTKIRARKMVG